MKSFLLKISIITLVLCIIVLCRGQVPPVMEIKQEPELLQMAKKWADKLGGELWHFGEFATRKNQVVESFKQTKVVVRDGEQLLLEIHNKVKSMMDKKVLAVQRIMEVAENSAVESSSPNTTNYQYYNVKELVNLTPDETHQPDFNLDEMEKCPFKEKEVKKRVDRKFNTMRKINAIDTSQFRDYLQNDEIGDGFQESMIQRDQEIEASEETEPQEEDILVKTKAIEVTDGDEIETDEDPKLAETAPENKTFLSLVTNSHFFDIPVNLDHSAVHVPANVYNRSEDVLRGVKWSEELDKTFKNNYKQDPTLSWQYFGSTTGFMRQYPAMKWELEEDSVDLFDCRTRSWFIEAASSPKDVLILVDRSGSMTGMRREIARHVVNNILDTLGNNDFVNVFTFGNETTPLVDCFANILVQANLANVRVFKESMFEFKTEQIADFPQALTLAFKILREYRDNRLGAQCNQAIMLITDGVQENFRDIFKEYNWYGEIPEVRMFTYLIGREVSEVRDIQWMACANRGYYVHLSEISEVREQVLKYIPVMSRPMILEANLSPKPVSRPNPVWSPVYADVADPKLTNWLWMKRQRRDQREKFLIYKNEVRKKKNEETGQIDTTMEEDMKFVFQQKKDLDRQGEMQSYTLMTSVSVPVFDRRKNETLAANLLGVAGTDIPLKYIQRLLMPYAIGVNAYAFIISNNGYVLIHPDLRPVFQGILKPAYNRVDFTEIEVEDARDQTGQDRGPRDFTEQIIELRRKIVMQEKGKKMMLMKTHLDEMRRIMLGKRHFYYMGIGGKPFSLVLALPDKYGFARVHYDIADDIHRMRSNNKGPPRTFFEGSFWKIHPDWLYCKYLQDSDDRFESPEKELLHFLNRIDCPKWHWGTTPKKIDDPLPKEECDRNLVNSLVADARITKWFNKNISDSKDDTGHEFIQRFGITVSFIATSSGLTRWQDFPQNTADLNSSKEQHFSELHKRAIDEVWYKRAVIQHYVEPQSFVYSVPFEVGENNETLVTASHAIFRDDGTKKAPAAVIGYQFFHTALYSLFRNITGSCGDHKCKRTCSSLELDCYVLDNNGYVVVGDKPADTGMFFGKLRPDIMLSMVKDDIYQRVKMYDYQATCFQSLEASNPAMRLLTPLTHFYNILQWSLGTLLYYLHLVSGETDPGIVSYGEEGGGDGTSASDQPQPKANEKDYAKYLIEKSRPTSCDKEMWMYYLVHYPERDIPKSPYNRPLLDTCERKYIAQPVVASNLILVVVSNICESNKPDENVQIDPEEVTYDNLTLVCYRVLYNNYTRRQYMSCINYHPAEVNVTLQFSTLKCGKGFCITPNLFLLAVFVVTISLYN